MENKNNEFNWEEESMNIELKREYGSRMQNARKEAAKRGFSCLLVLGLAPRRVGDLMYLCGHQPLLPGHPRRFTFRGRGFSAIVLPVEEEPCLLTTTPFYEKDLYIKDIKYGDNLPEEIANAIKRFGLEKSDIGIVGMDILSVSLYEDLKRELYQARFFHADDIIMNLRAAKSEYEINIMRAGAKIADEVSVMLRNFLRPGLKEKEVFDFITGELTKRGVTGAFATCQSGWRSETAYELIPASEKVIEAGDMVHMEINGKYQGYMIDVCRSTVAGSASERQIEILDTALEMFEKTVAAMKPGITAGSLEKISGGIALKKGFDHNHTRTYNGPATFLGHAIGLGVDEPPVIVHGDKTMLVPGMVITIEPGLYNTGYGGCRIEDEILVTETGYENLNLSERKWW
jgi:Xaa-Pro aminopeptidase